MGPTIKDVAKKAKVSVATVSRVLNNQPGYSEKTKKKVLQVIKEMGYQPNAIARGLINKRTQTIGVLFPSVSSLFSSKVLHGIEHIAHERDHSVIVCNTDTDGKRTMKYLQVLGEKQVDGIIFTSEVLTEDYYRVLKAMNIPVILVSTFSLRYPFPYVKVDDKHAAYHATEYLIKQGHRKIAMISGTEGDEIAGTPRIEGYREALRDYGIPFQENLFVFGDFGYRSGCAAMKKLLERGEEFTAVFAASDEMATGALSVAYQHGIKVPDQLSIIGYDNLQIAEMSVPPLTTVAQPLFEMGKLAAEMLLTMIETGVTVESRIMPHSIIERQTVAKPL
ncbi:LacI family DNA-binding transcriptional regulator [Paenactinomyces guangxiensis]|uniref:Substrate-binding domain-containing protein n=1 Tax=Paenactinomyces guangxiensis TaxID=1490290 RepID=A0A7W1WUW4_9BACL|nr:substrate-binding domain-containing protein [Paenactinomyces guangxiensis]MBA4496447.1 substrate-binding domain-containing protein [Paenactinomyces guangxiensis]MBH8593563.1 substrate-binding domain-containing protein [Paenactinomyces guangxiensis]